jgi:hypothetical protein
MGFVFHPISTKYWFLKHYFLFCFPFYKRLVYGTYTISCLPLAYFTFEKNSTSLEKVSRTFWPPMFQLVSLNIFKFHSTWVHSQLRCFKSLSNKFFFSNDNPCTSYAHHWFTTLYPLILQFLIKWMIIWYFQMDSLQLNPRLREYFKPLQIDLFFLEQLIFPHTYLTPPFFSINTLTSWIDFMPPYSPLVLYLYFHHYPSKPWIYLFPSFVCHKQSDNKFSF